MKFSNILYNDVLESSRLNAGFHLSDGTQYEKIIRNLNHKTIEQVTQDVFTAGRSKRVYTDSEFGFPYLSNSNVTKQIPFEGCKYNSKKYAFDESALLKYEMTVTGRVGAIGQTAYISRMFETFNSMGSDNIIRIVPNKTIKSGYLYTFFASKYGKTLLLKLAAGGVQPYISEAMILKLPIPIFDELVSSEIHNNITLASEYRDEANLILRKCQEKFIGLLNIDNEELSKITNPSEKKIDYKFKVQNNELSLHTFRARNYSKRKERIIELLSSQDYDRLEDVLLRDPYYGSRYKRIESSSKNGLNLLSQGEIFERIPVGRVISKKSIKNIENEIVDKGTILVPAQGTLGENEVFGRAKFVWGYLENKLVAGHSMRFIPDDNKIDSGYLFCVLNSSLWFRLFRTSVYGTNLLGFIVPILNALPIPRFDKNVELEIGKKVKKAYDLFTKANDIEKYAVLTFEKEIEKWQK